MMNVEMEIALRRQQKLMDEIKKLKETNRYLRDQLKKYREQYGKLDDFWIQNER